MQHRSEVVVRLGVAGIELHRGAVAGLGLRIAPGSLPYPPHRVMRRRLARAGLQRAARPLQAFVDLLRIGRDRREEKKRASVAR